MFGLSLGLVLGLGIPLFYTFMWVTTTVMLINYNKYELDETHSRGYREHHIDGEDQTIMALAAFFWPFVYPTLLSIEIANRRPPGVIRKLQKAEADAKELARLEKLLEE